MIIQGRFGEYDVVWAEYGWSYAQAYVRVKSKFLWFIPYWKTVWHTGSNGWSSTTSAVCAKKMLKDQMINWFEHAVYEYEKWLESWGEINERNF